MQESLAAERPCLRPDYEKTVPVFVFGAEKPPHETVSEMVMALNGWLTRQGLTAEQRVDLRLFIIELCILGDRLREQELERIKPRPRRWWRFW